VSGEPASGLRVWGSLLTWLGQRWRGEVAMLEARPWVAAGFGLGLLFRPAIVVAASHVLGRLQPELPLPELEPEPKPDRP